ncbi:MAG: hypothetical protein BGO78_03445 [Chloroflexi bacterium 44-23]|nr:MAG: hypothetical protein BGO78_03445 [Chloroflexi bacterium 44-23]
MQSKVEWFTKGLRRRYLQGRNNRNLTRLASQVAQHSSPDEDIAPVVFFNASTRLVGMSLNAAFSLISAWSLRLQGVPIINFICKSGMSHCMLGSTLGDPLAAPPCKGCIHQSQVLFHKANNEWFDYQPNPDLSAQLQQLSLTQLVDFQWDAMPLGALILPGIRWVLRCHHLKDDSATRQLYAQYILSAENIARQFKYVIENYKPQKIIVFNGISYPEATVRWVALQHGIPVVTHEVGLMPYSAFFSEGQATEYPINIPETFVLTPQQNQKLDNYLQNRFQGNFEMAGIRFWPSIRSLSSEFLQFANQFEQIVPVFTNVIFDTSQSQANIIFSNMFDWLDSLIPIIRQTPNTLFVIRAHPDESRPGKASRESVADWVKEKKLQDLPNVKFVESNEFINSYELIQRSKFVLIYNSTVGMEAVLLGTNVIAAGQSRFTSLPTVYFPKSAPEYLEMVQSFLANGTSGVPEIFVQNVRRFLYTQLYRVSLPFDKFIEEDQVWNGYVHLRDINWSDLLPENSATLKTISEGILFRKPFELDR